jgi:hypothetical protein
MSKRFVVLPLTKRQGVFHDKNAAISAAETRINRNQGRFSLQGPDTEYLVAEVAATVRAKNVMVETETRDEK